ncbi:MAG: C-GCAxxG-C-C family protein [Anaerofustis sp.]
MDHKQKAIDNFKKGFNCAQSVFVAFTDVTGMDEASAAKLSSSFGGGMGGMKEVCGVLSGAFMVLGIKYGFTEKSSPDEKKEHYARIKSFGDKFTEKYGSLVCRDLEGWSKADGFLKGEQNNEFYQKKPCAVYVEYAAELLDEFLK